MNEQETTAPEETQAVEEQSVSVEEQPGEIPVEEGSAAVEEQSVSVDDLGLSDSALPGETEDTRLRAVIEAAIYITDEPLLPKQIAEGLGQPQERIDAILTSLVEEYSRPERGLSIRELAGGYKMGTKAEHHEDLRIFVKKLKPQLKLSLAALETLAVIAYKQPITAPEIMEIRGVQGAGVLKTLLDRKLITAAGRKAVVGKPVLYKSTKEFLIQFGLKDLSELPTLKEFEEISRLALGDESDLAPDSAPTAASAPPAENAAEEPSSGEPGMNEPTAGESKSNEPAAEQPPMEEPPPDQPAVEEPPVEQPPADEPPGGDPPAEEPAVEEPPADEPEPKPNHDREGAASDT